jgi:molybdate transport system regulatory protein
MIKIQNTPIVGGDIKLIGGLNERLFRLLAAVETTGSINQAAKDVGLTYKGAWEMIERANNLSPQLLISTAVGGRQGGGTQLTAAGKGLLNLFLQIQAEHQQFLAQINQRLVNDQEVIHLLKRLVVKASARNQFFGKVTKVVTDEIDAEIIVALKGGETLVATMTKPAVKSLAIRAGTEVMALIKAPEIMLITDFANTRLSARNQLQGTVARIQKGAVNAEVVVKLKGGNSIAATITNESLETLALAIGHSTTAVFKAGAVILGVAS